jgi:Tol biopolymer transport system component
MRKAPLFVTGLILTLSVSGCSDASGPESGFGRWILFTGKSATHPGADAVYAIRPEGGDVVKLTNGLGEAFFPRWSRDRSQIAFATGASGAFEVWTMRADRTGAHAVSNPNDFCNQYTRLSWSSGGDRILADCQMVNQFVITVSDRSSYSLTQRWANVADIPDWSPLGDRILFLRGTDTFVANLDGSQTSVVVSPATQSVWSPDGTRIAFVRTNANQSDMIFTANADGTNVRQLTFPVNRDISDDSPAWSPDGARIVYVRNDVSNLPAWFLHVMNADGSGDRTISPDTLLSTHPDW